MTGRLKRTAEYQRVQGRGRRIRSANLLLLVLPGAAPETRVGLTVSRKNGDAVRRNRMKRWLREIVRALPPPQGGPWDFVLIPHAEAREAGFAGLSVQVKELFGKVRR